MKLKRFENFDLDSINPSKPITRDDLMGKPYELENKFIRIPKFDVVYAVEFVPSGTFSAKSNAVNYLNSMGYVTGSMQGDNPIGFAKSFDYIAKWDTITYDEYKHLDGIIIPQPEFREGGNLVLFFKPPNF